MGRKITIVHMNNSLDYIQVGEKVLLEKHKDNTKDPKAIKAFYHDSFIGYVAVSGTTIAPGTLSGHDVWDDLPDAIELEVVDHAIITTTSTKTVLILNVDGDEEQQKGAGTVTEDVKMVFKVKGSATKYKGKATVLENFQNNIKVFLNLKLEGDKVLAELQEGTERDAGFIEEKEQSNCSSMEDLALLKELLEKGEEIEAKVKSVAGASFFISLSISADVVNNCKAQTAKAIIEDKKAELVAAGYEEELLVEIEDYLSNNNFSAVEIAMIFDTYMTYPEHVQGRIIKHLDCKFKDNFGALKVAFASMMNGYHVLCSGDKGTGKNRLIQTWAWVTQRPLYELSINRETDKLDMMGSRTIDAEVDENGNVINSISFAPEILLEAMEVGGIMNIDEINFADPGVTGLLHSICDDRRTIEVPGYRKVEAGQNFTVMATMNVDYQGTNDLNEALADRFVDIIFPSNTSIFEILQQTCPEASESEIQKADNIYQRMCSIIQNRDGDIDENCLTVRGFIQGLSMSKFLGLKKALIVSVANKIKDEEYRKNVERIINSQIS